jgi:hypothetical protein
MLRPDRQMPSQLVWEGEVVTFVRECGRGLIVRTADGLEPLVWWDEVEPSRK